MDENAVKVVLEQYRIAMTQRSMLYAGICAVLTDEGMDYDRVKVILYKTIEMIIDSKLLMFDFCEKSAAEAILVLLVGDKTIDSINKDNTNLN